MPVVRVCEEPGCRTYLPAGRRLCDVHRQPPVPKYIKHEWQLWYRDHRWAKLSRAIRNAEPFCRPCMAEGRVSRSEQVDHIVPHNGDEKLFWDQSNMQAICAVCHGIKTRAERGEGETACTAR